MKILKHLMAACAFVVIYAEPAQANKSSVVIQEPVQFTSDGKALLLCTVSHNGNNFLHHTQWLRVKANGNEIALWEFSWKDNPEDENFTRQVTVEVAAPAIIEAESSCNIHGSNGPAKITLMPPGRNK